MDLLKEKKLKSNISGEMHRDTQEAANGAVFIERAQ